MPSSVIAAAVAGAVAGTAATIGTVAGFGFAFSWASFASSLVMSGLSAALKPKAPAQQQQSLSYTDQGRTVTMRQPISSWRVIYGEARVGGAVTYKKVTNSQRDYHMIVTFAGHACEAIDEVWFGDEVVPLDGSGNATGKWAGYVTIKKSLGDEAGQPFPDLVTASAGEWTDRHRQSGRTKIYVKLTAHAEKFPNGIPNITSVIRGKNDIYDPRTGTTGWSDNPALCINNYLTDTIIGRGVSYANQINAADLIASANICDEAVTLKAGGSEVRYTLNGSFLVSEQPVDIIERMASAMAGHVVQIGAQWNILAGAYLTPTITLAADDLAGPLQWQTMVSRRDSCNGVKGIFTDPGSNYQPTDFPAIKSETFLAQDNGERVWHDLDLSAFVQSGTQAQRISKIELFRTRQGMTMKWPGRLDCYKAQPGKTVMVTLEKYGISAKPFFVVGGNFSMDEDGALLYTLDLRETAAAVFDWSTSEEQAVDISPNTDLGDPLTVAAPGAPTITESKYETSGSAGVKARATMAWAAPTDTLVIERFPEYRVAAGTWTAIPQTRTDFADINDVAPGQYEFRVRWINKLGVMSDYGPTVTREIVGLSDAPADVQNFSVVAFNGAATGTWGLTPDLDVKIGGRAVIRWTPLTSGAVWENGVDIAEFNGDAVTAPLPMFTGTYLAKFKDSTGNWSTTAASFVLTAGTLTALANSQTITESPTFPGTKSNVAAVDSKLKLDGVTLIDSITDLVDEWPFIDGMGGIQPAGSYTFSSQFDFGSVVTRRVSASIQALAIDTGDLIDSRGPVDEWDSVDGNVINDATATLMAATSPDGASYGPWFPMMAADVTCRAIKFRLDLASAQATHNIEVSTLQVTAQW